MSELTGRDLDAAVAEAMGWKWWNFQHPDPNSHHNRYKFIRPPEWKPADDYKENVIANVRPAPADMPPFVGDFWEAPKYSAADCSGLAPVLAWLTEQYDEGSSYCELQHHHIGGEGWVSLIRCHDATNEIPCRGFAPTLPESACRLLVAWAARVDFVGRKGT